MISLNDNGWGRLVMFLDSLIFRRNWFSLIVLVIIAKWIIALLEKYIRLIDLQMP